MNNRLHKEKVACTKPVWCWRGHAISLWPRWPEGICPAFYDW
jgi:hypothetical protein